MALVPASETARPAQHRLAAERYPYLGACRSASSPGALGSSSLFGRPLSSLFARLGSTILLPPDLPRTGGREGHTPQSRGRRHRTYAGGEDPRRIPGRHNFPDLMRISPLTFNTIALELVPPNVEHGADQAIEEAHKVLQLSAAYGLEGRIRHVLVPGMIAEEEDRPVEMKPKLDVLDFWSIIKPELPGTRGLCTQVTAFMDEQSLSRRLADLGAAGIEGIVFVGVPRTMADGAGSGVAPTDALSIYQQQVPNRGAIMIPTREGEQGRFRFKCDRGATFALTQLLYSDAITDFLAAFAKNSDHRPEILLSFGFVPKAENRVGLINWLIQDSGNVAVAGEQEFVRTLANSEPAQRRKLMVDLYKRVIDGVADLGYPLSIHLEATYGVSARAFETFAEMLDYWSPIS